VEVVARCGEIQRHQEKIPMMDPPVTTKALWVCRLAWRATQKNAMRGTN
jgi:hypothetical protein